MPETLTLKVIDVIHKKDGSGDFWKAHFAEGKKATFFHESLKKVLDNYIDKPLSYELKPGKEASWDPSITKVLDGDKPVWSPGGGGGGGKPFLTDQQLGLVVGGLNNIAEAIRELGRAVTPAPAKQGGQSASGSPKLPARKGTDPSAGGPEPHPVPAPPRRPEGGNGPSPPSGVPQDPNRERLLSELATAAHEAFPDSTKLWQQWLKTDLSRRKVWTTEDLDLRGLTELVESVKSIASHRTQPAEVQ